VEDFFDLDKLKAKVYLMKDGDTSNMAMVTDEKLMFVRNGKKMRFSLPEVKGLSSGNKKQLFPLIVGGIVAPFAFLSYFTNMFHPFFHLIFTLIGLLLFYIGVAGRAVLVVLMSKGEEELIYLPSVSSNLLAFIDYINGQLVNTGDAGLNKFIFIEIEKSRYSWLYGQKRSRKINSLVGVTPINNLQKPQGCAQRLLPSIQSWQEGRSGLYLMQSSMKCVRKLTVL
jgi:hypothetical protein